MKKEKIIELIKKEADVYDQQTLDRFVDALHEVAPEDVDVITTKQAAQIWNLRSSILYGLESAYSDSTIRLRSDPKNKRPLPRLTKEDKINVFGADVPARSYFWLEDVLTIDIRPWKNLGLRKPLFLKRAGLNFTPVSSNSHHRTTRKRKKRSKA